MKRILLSLALAASFTGCASHTAHQASDKTATTSHAQPTADDARAFIRGVEDALEPALEKSARTAWLQANFINFDSTWLAAKSGEEMTAMAVAMANEAKKFNGVTVDPVTRRKLEMIKLGLTIPAPVDAKKNAELAQIQAELTSMYGTGKYCKPGGKCYTLNELEDIMTHSRNPEQLKDAWVGWRTISPPMRPKYQRMVALANEGARELGYADTGAMWRLKYDMPPEEFSAELDRLWNQVKPLYDALQCHVRSKLTEKYGQQVVGSDGKIPAHLLGNMWAQSWGNIYDLVKPEKEGTPVDVTALIKAHNYDAIKMVKTGEGFFTSLGFAPLPETFWQRSLFTKPRDREVVCHASAWDLDNKDDLRIKMCIKTDEEDFVTIHHELGHNFYQRAYKNQPIIFREGANDGFHEAIGDTIALSITPEYLKKIGLLDKVPESDSDLGMLMKMALDKVAFLPFGLMIDQWRWKVFNGEISPQQYNAGWWALREKYQGVKPPVARSEKDFDPGAKYHIPANTPYTRYFLAHILEFQLHRELCKAAGYQGQLHKCSIYGSSAAGDKLKRMLELGASRPWQEALEIGANSRDMDATAILDYFAPLKAWLDEQNKGRDCGW
jgi:peptidyl-dipeptidase A